MYLLLLLGPKETVVFGASAYPSSDLPLLHVESSNTRTRHWVLWSLPLSRNFHVAAFAGVGTAEFTSVIELIPVACVRVSVSPAADRLKLV